MKYKNLFFILLAAMACVLETNAKATEGIIMTVDDEQIPTEEFLYLFQKNNQQQMQPQSIDDYMNLFEIYRLKVAEAKRLGVDTTTSFNKEISLYKKELLEPYITDSLFFKKLVNEAAAREKELVESSHIMIIRTNDAEKDARNLQLLDSLRTEILNGNDFIELAKTYSQDKFSSAKGGYLGFNPAGTFPYGFETAVYETPEGEISEIVESHVGWHIVKAGGRKSAEEAEYPVKSMEDIEADVARKTSSPFDVRYHQIRKNRIASLKQRHKDLNVDGLSDDDAYNLLLEAEEKVQYATNPDYRNLVDEYVNGSLLYEVSVDNVWNKASNDTEGLETYFNGNRNKYQWEKPHAKGILVQALNDSVAGLIKEKVAGLPQDSVIPVIRKDFRKEAQADRFNAPQGINPMVDYLMFGGEEASPKTRNFTVCFVIDGRIVENPENLDDVKGAVVNDYQEELEKQWVATLKKNHKVEINKKELNRIRKTLK